MRTLHAHLPIGPVQYRRVCCGFITCSMFFLSPRYIIRPHLYLTTGVLNRTRVVNGGPYRSSRRSLVSQKSAVRICGAEEDEVGKSSVTSATYIGLHQPYTLTYITGVSGQCYGTVVEYSTHRSSAVRYDDSLRWAVQNSRFCTRAPRGV